MSCDRFEARLDAYLGDRLPAAERVALEAHLAACDRCGELVQLARIAYRGGGDRTAPPDDLAASVLEHTAGAPCGAAERQLCDLIDDRLSDADAELVRRHLAGCPDCAALAVAVERLGLELPLMADIRPDREFVASVLNASLPWRVRAARWWRATWPRWLRRPRFALEAAYVATMVLVVIFTTPVSPLEAMPRRAVEIVRTVPQPEVGTGWTRVEERLGRALDGVLRSEGVVAVVDGWRSTLELGGQQLDNARELAGRTPGWAREQIRTFWQALASLLESADGDPAAADPESDEETS